MPSRSTETPIRSTVTPVLRVNDLEVAYPSAGPSPVVRGLDLEILPGESVGVLGESGCGKTSFALATVGLLPKGARVRGAVELAGAPAPAPEDERRWRELRGRRVGVVFQQPSLALNPFRKVDAHVIDVLRSHFPWDERRCRVRARDLLGELDLPTDVFDAFPHQLSGGQQQRVVLAQALACEPDLLVADEPTTALDRRTENRVLELLDRSRRERRTSLLWISHDPEVLERIADRLAVMYAGRWMEIGPARRVLESPRHPYTRALLACRPRRKARPGEPLLDRRLPTLPERKADRPPPDPDGCPFVDRCPHAAAPCREPQEAVAVDGGIAWCGRLDALGALDVAGAPGADRA